MTVKLSADWVKVLAWINHPLLHPKPTPDETRAAMTAFLEAVNLENCEADPEMVPQLLPAN